MRTFLLVLKNLIIVWIVVYTIISFMCNEFVNPMNLFGEYVGDYYKTNEIGRYAFLAITFMTSLITYQLYKKD